MEYGFFVDHQDWQRYAREAAAGMREKDAPEGRKGFLLNHLISDLTPRGDYANADPVTGQAAWFDLRVSIRKRGSVTGASAPQFTPLGFTEANEAPLRYGATMRDSTSRKRDSK